MSGIRMSKRVFIGIAVAVGAIGISAGLIWATTGSSPQSMLIGRATFQPTVGDVLQVQREQPPNWGVVVQARPALDVAVQTITFPPNANSGWHSHPGPVFISVVQGEMTFYMGDDPDCKPTVRHAGEGFLDTGEHVHIARNESGLPATNVVTYFLPPGAPLRINQPNPGNCPF